MSNDNPRRPAYGQEPLIAAGDVQRPVGKVEEAIAASVAAAGLSDVDAGGGALAVACAKAVDIALRHRDPYGVAAAARELREQLVRLRLDPASRDDGAGGDVDWFRRLMSGEAEDPHANAGAG